MYPVSSSVLCNDHCREVTMRLKLTILAILVTAQTPGCSRNSGRTPDREAVEDVQAVSRREAVGPGEAGARREAVDRREAALLFPDQFAGLRPDSYLSRKLQGVREHESLRPFREAAERQAGRPFHLFVHATMQWTPEDDPYRTPVGPTDASEVLTVFAVAVWKDGERLTILHNVPDDAALRPDAPGFRGPEGPRFDFGPVLPLAVPRTLVRLCPSKDAKGGGKSPATSCCTALSVAGDKVLPTGESWDAYDLDIVHRRNWAGSGTWAGINCYVETPDYDDFNRAAHAILSCVVSEAERLAVLKEHAPRRVTGEATPPEPPSCSSTWRVESAVRVRDLLAGLPCRRARRAGSC
jgi:hypothetical protein